MANVTIGNLTEETTVEGEDLVEIEVDPSGTPASRKATVENIQADWHVGARVYHNANQSIADATSTILSFNSEDYDTDGIHDNVTNNSRLTCQTAGKYTITASISFDANNTGDRSAAFVLNGTTSISGQRVLPSNNGYTMLTPVVIYDLSVSDYVEVRVYQNSGGALNVVFGAEYSPYFIMQRIG